MIDKILGNDIVQYFDSYYTYKTDHWIEDTFNIKSKAGGIKTKILVGYDGYSVLPFDNINNVFDFDMNTYRSPTKNDYVLKTTGFTKCQYDKIKIEKYLETITDDVEMFKITLALFIQPRKKNDQPFVIITSDENMIVYNIFHDLFNYNLSALSLIKNGPSYIQSTKFHLCNSAHALNKKNIPAIISGMQVNGLKKLVLYTTEPEYTYDEFDKQGYICLIPGTNDIGGQKNNAYIDTDLKNEIICYIIDNLANI